MLISPPTEYKKFDCINVAINYRDTLYKRLASSKPRYKDGVRIDKTFVELNHVYREITLLIDQYYSSISVKKELYYKLVDLGLIKLEK
jgi:hypothetical protein